MTENEQFQRYRLNKPPMPPWRRWFIIAFGILLPVFFGAVGCSFVIASQAPLWAMAIPATLGLGSALVSGTFDLFAINLKKKMRSGLGYISAFMLMMTLGLTAEVAIPQHSVSFVFIAGFVFSYSVGLFVGFLCFNAWLARPRT